MRSYHLILSLILAIGLFPSLAVSEDLLNDTDLVYGHASIENTTEPQSPFDLCQKAMEEATKELHRTIKIFYGVVNPPNFSYPTASIKYTNDRCIVSKVTLMPKSWRKPHPTTGLSPINQMTIQNFSNSWQNTIKP